MTATERGFQVAAAMLLREAFEGMPAGQNYTWFVQGKEGLFDALSAVTAEEASRKPAAECASIAAHAYHILYILRCANAQAGGPEPEGSWEDTWKVQTASDSEWAGLIERIRGEYHRYVPWLESNSDWQGEHAFVEGLVPLPHIAFHLGAIRQLLKVI